MRGGEGLTIQQKHIEWPDAVVFDLDGTLIDSAADIGLALNEVMANRGLPAFTLDQVKEMIGGGVVKLLERALRAQGLPPEGAVPVASEFLQIYQLNPVRETTLYPGAREMLTLLQEAGVGIGLCTNKPHGVTEQILHEMDLACCFGSVLGGKDGMPRKPDPAPLRAVMATLNAAPGRTLMVGDSAADVGAARGAGTPVVVVSYGYSKTPVGELGADLVIDELAEVAGAVRVLKFGARAG